MLAERDGKFCRAMQRFLEQEREMIWRKREIRLEHSQLKRELEKP